MSLPIGGLAWKVDLYAYRTPLSPKRDHVGVRCLRRTLDDYVKYHCARIAPDVSPLYYPQCDYNMNLIQHRVVLFEFPIMGTSRDG